MKITLIFFIALVIYGTNHLVNSESSDDEEEQKIKLAEQFAEACFGQDGSTKADFDEMFRKKQLPKTKPQKCLSACMHEQFEIIKDGKFNKEAFVGMSKSVANDPKKDPLIDDIGETCEKEVDADRCELAGKVVLCYKRVAEKHGYDWEKIQRGDYSQTK